MKSYTLEYRPDLRIMVLRWLRPTTLAEVQESYAATLALARQHACPDWLLDARRTGPIEIEETAWLANTFFPAAALHFAPRALRLAVFSSPLRIEQLRTDARVAPAVLHALGADRPYQASVFANEGMAVAWLADAPPHSGARLA